MSVVTPSRPGNFLPTQPAGPSNSTPLIAPVAVRPAPTPEEKADQEAVTPPRRPPSRTEKKFVCDHPGCDKAYFKPSRLAEHRLTHTGERPHACPHCSQSYLRASHLTAHLRTHLEEQDKPYVCTKDGCGKRFWTSTHLKRHQDVHDQVASYKCEHCPEAFTKAHALRDHVTLVHMPPGTKPYPCTHEGCTWSFALKHQLKAHEKTHDPTRYTCSHPDHDDFPSFPTWSALQHHLHTEHPPKCPYPECKGRTFKSAGRLKDHLKVHAEREVDLSATVIDGDTSNDALDGLSRRKRRRSEAGELGEAKKLRRLSEGVAGKQFGCTHEGCAKSFKTKFALASHVSATHLGAKYYCPVEGCNLGFAHKSSLQKHIASHDSAKSAAEKDADDTWGARGDFTGSTQASLKYGCPINHVLPDTACLQRFNRVYDLRRHLKGVHSLDLDTLQVRLLLSKYAKETDGGNEA